MRIIVSGGGTGGHIYPAITLVQAIRAMVPSAEFLYVGTSLGLESDLVPKEGLPFATIDLQGFERSLTPDNFRRAWKALAGLFKARDIVREFQPDLAIGTGGYVCGPILLAASLMGVPSLIQEQNVVPGVTNRILARFVSKIAAGMEGAVARFPAGKAVFTGNPIRAQVLEGTREEGCRAYGFDPQRKIVLISGGSRGARSINLAMVELLAAARSDSSVQYLHVTGTSEFEMVMAALSSAGVRLEEASHIAVRPYLYDMPQAMAMADLAVFRAGATGLAELTARGIPAILIPYPYAAENHQEHNARELMEGGAARMILNRDLTAEVLGREIHHLLGNAENLRAMGEKSRAMGRPQAAHEIARLALELAGRG